MNSLSKLALVLTFCTGMIACSGGKAVKGDYGVVPLPQEVTLTNGNPFVLSPSTKIFYPEGNDKMKKNAEFLASYIKEITGYELATATGQPGTCSMARNSRSRDQPRYRPKHPESGRISTDR